MNRIWPSRRFHLGLFLCIFALLVFYGLSDLSEWSGWPSDPQDRTLLANAAELKVPDAVPVKRFHFEQTAIEARMNVDGRDGWLEAARRAQGA